MSFIEALKGGKVGPMLDELRREQMKGAGYEDPKDKQDEPIFVTFFLEPYKAQHTANGINARVLRNGKPVGMVHLESERELEILKSQIDGSYNLDTGAYTIVEWNIPEK